MIVIRPTLFTALVFIVMIPAKAQYKFEFNVNCQHAYYHMMSMHFIEADSLLALEKMTRPDNLMPYFIEDIKDFFILSFNENPEEIKKLEPNKQKRIDILSKGPRESPYYLYTQGEILLHWSFVYVANEQYTTGFFELRKASHLLQENEEKFPDFIANKKFLGLIHAIAGTIPDSYKWAASFLGLKGTVPQGMAEINEVMDFGSKHPFLFEDETRYIYLFMQLWLQNDVSGAWQATESAEYPPLKDNPLSTYVKAFLATKMNKNDLAVRLFSEANFSKNVFIPDYIFYMTGISKLRRLDEDANAPLENFVAHFRGSNYLKDAYRELAWSYFLKGNESKYSYFLSFCKTKGKTFTDSDKEALEEANSGITPNIILLKVRLLTDGGYFDRAFRLVHEKEESSFTSEKDKLEFNYRMGRLYDQSGERDKAIPYYITTISRGENFSSYYADNASLQLAVIYESRNDSEHARYYYTKCLAMKNNVYKTSIDQKAKAGLNRINAQQK